MKLIDGSHSNDTTELAGAFVAKDKLKICVVGPSKYFFSGLTANTIFLSNALAKDNDVSVILLRKLVPQFLYPGKKHLNKNNYLINLNKNLDVYEKLDWNSPLSWIRASHFLKQHQPDVIIMLWWSATVAHMQLFLTFVNKISVKAKLILEIHEITDPLEEKTLPIRLYARLALKSLIRTADAFTAHSPSVKDQISVQHRIDKNKIFVKPLGLYEAYKSNYDSNLARLEFDIHENFIILTFGSIRKYKGIPYLLKAFSDLPESIANNSRLVIAGEDWGDDDELIKLINSSRYRSRITFNPHFIDDKDIPKYFSLADVVVLPYLRSSGSAVGNIAMSYGKAVITSDIESLRECFKDYLGVHFTPVADPEAIKEKLINLFHLKGLGGNTVYGAPQDSWKVISEKYVEIINNIRTNKCDMKHES